MRDAQINVRTESKIKEESAKILRRIGMTTSEAVNLFLHRVVMEKGIPFDLRIPTRKTEKALEEAYNRENLESAETVDEMFEKLDL